MVLFFGGAIVTALIVAAFPDTKWWHVTLGFLAGGFLAYLLTYVGLALIGALIGGLAGFLLFGAEPTAVIICSFVGALVTIIVHEAGLIIASSLIGAGFVTAMFANIATIFTSPQSMTANNGFAVIADFVTIYLNRGLIGFAERAEIAGYIFILLFLIGIAFQMFWRPSDIVPEVTASPANPTSSQPQADQQAVTPPPPVPASTPEPAAEPQSDAQPPSGTDPQPAAAEPETAAPAESSPPSEPHSEPAPSSPKDDTSPATEPPARTEVAARIETANNSAVDDYSGMSAIEKNFMWLSAATAFLLIGGFLIAGLLQQPRSSPPAAYTPPAHQTQTAQTSAGDVLERRREFGQDLADAEQHGFFKVRTASNLRTGPGTSHAIELTLPEHTILRVVGRAPASADWLAVEVESIREQDRSMRRGFLYRPLVEPLIARRGTNPWEPRSNERVVLQRFDNGFFEGVQAANGQRRLGVYVWNDGSWYAGEWDGANRSGRGQQLYRDGGHYDGEWRNHNRHGRGEVRWPNGDRYVGDWSDDRRTGNGTYYWPNGSRHVGEWLNNQRHGRGIAYFANGNRREAVWRDDRLHGTARFVLADGTATTEYWNNGERADAPPPDASAQPPAPRTPSAGRQAAVSSSRQEAARALIANNCSNIRKPPRNALQTVTFGRGLLRITTETDDPLLDDFVDSLDPSSFAVSTSGTANTGEISFTSLRCPERYEQRTLDPLVSGCVRAGGSDVIMRSSSTMYCRNRREVVDALVTLGATRAGQDRRESPAASAITHGPALRIASARAKWEVNSPARLAIDGSLSTTYGSRGIYDFDRDPNMWWEADLGSVRDVGSMRLMWGVVPTYKRVTISGSQDRRSYTQITGPLDVNTTGQWTDIALSGRHRYIRINYVGSGSGGHGLDLTEVEIFAPQARQQAQTEEYIFRCTTANNREASVRIEGSQAVYRYRNLNTGQVELTLSRPVQPGFIDFHPRGRQIQFRNAPDYTYEISEIMPSAFNDIGAGTYIDVRRGSHHLATIECRDVQTSLIFSSQRLGY